MCREAQQPAPEVAKRADKEVTGIIIKSYIVLLPLQPSLQCSSARYHHTDGTNGLALGVIGDGLPRLSRLSDVCNGILQLIRFSLAAPLADKVAAVSVNERGHVYI